MRFLLTLIFAALAFGQNTPTVNQPISTFFPLSAIPMWVTVTVTNNSTNLTVTCAGPASFTAICGTSPVAKAGAVTQSVTLATPGVNFSLEDCAIKSATAFVGPTTLNGTVGITGKLTGCTSVGYDLMAAVATGNVGIPTLVSTTKSFNGTDAIILALTSTIQNISSISAGSTVVYLKIALIP